MSKYLEFKANQKSIAHKIRTLKAQRSAENNGYIPELEGIRYDYRHRHVAYCLIRGRSYDQIEANPNTSVSWFYVKKYVEEILGKEIEYTEDRLGLML